MSKIGKKPITIPDSVTVSLSAEDVRVKGPKGELAVPLHPKVLVAQEGSTLVVSVKKPEDRRQKALWGTFRSLIANAVSGVQTGFEKKLEIVGVGYKAAIAGQKLTLNLGHSHPIVLDAPAGIVVKGEKTTVTVSGFDKQAVGQFASLVRSQRKPEPYKGKGVKYADEVIRRKAGKVVKAVGG